MEYRLFLEITKGLSLLFSLALFQSFVIRYWPNNEKIGQVSSGILFGSICVVGMIVPLEFAPGVIVDSRSIILSMAALFGGPITAIIAAVISGSYRLWLGGVGAGVGIGIIISAVVIGLGFRYAKHKKLIPEGALLFLLLGFTVHIASLFWIFFLPAEALEKFLTFRFPAYVAIYSFGTLIFGLLLKDGMDRIRVEEALKTSEKHSRAIFDQTFQFIGLMKTDGRLIEANRTSLKYAGITFEEVDGKFFWDTPWWSHSQEEQAKLKDAVKRANMGELVRFETTHPDPDGNIIYVDFSLKPVFGEDGSVELLIPEGRDISLRKNLAQQLRQSQKIEAVGQLSGGVSHHFNNLLAIMLGHAEVLGQKLENDPQSKRHIDALIKAVNRASTLTHRMLSFSRQQALFPKKVDIPTLLEDQAELLNEFVGEMVSLTFVSTNKIWPVAIDTIQFSSALKSLVSNACQAMQSDGSITINILNESLDETYTSNHEDVLPGDYVKLVISDTGRGMTTDMLEKAFEPFFSTRDVGKGSGLGLSMVYGFIKQSCGHITISSEPGIGTEVSLYIPRVTNKKINN